MKQWLIEQNPGTLISIGVAIIIILLAVYFLYTIINQAHTKYKIEKKISKLGIKQLKGIIIDDGMDSTIQIDRVFLTTNGIIALSVNFLSGNIFGDDKIDTWAQVVDKRTYRFPNPLFNFEHTLAALKYHFNDIQVEGKILFIGQCAFPTGQPACALLIDDIEDQQAGEQNIDKSIIDLWNKFEQNCEHVRHKKLELPDNINLAKRLALSIALILISSIWLFILIK
ncbi:MAG: NERD domain-containing protein [Gammaproteobacteria bacterium]|nr:NERD domain-containing protein [Gammaproteobacteria bacterium]